jgi:hypothetical protein
MFTYKLFEEEAHYEATLQVYHLTRNQISNSVTKRLLSMLENEIITRERRNSENICYCALPNLFLSNLLSCHMIDIQKISSRCILGGEVICYSVVKQITNA